MIEFLRGAGWRHSVLAILLAGCIVGPVEAADCTPAQRRDGDRWLWLNERDAKLSAERNTPWGEPKTDEADAAPRVLIHNDYLIGYDDDRRVPLWVAYRLDGTGLNRVAGRIECFREDERLPASARSRKSDYQKSGFDQGHLAPSEDMSHNVRQNVNSFILSNMAPQHSRFNRVIWRRLEAMGQSWAKLFRTVYVVSGSIFDADADASPDDPAAARRLKTRVGIPTHFFKVVARDCGDGRIESVAVILPHENRSRPGDKGLQFLKENIQTVAQVEAVTGLSLFPTEDAVRRVDRTVLWPTSSTVKHAVPACGE